MQRLPSRGKDSRPQVGASFKSFNRNESPASSPNARTRSNTVPDGTPYANDAAGVSLRQDSLGNDIFETGDSNEPELEVDSTADAYPNGFEELPVEIQSLMERFLESLHLKTHSAPLSINQLSDLYQNFYLHVETHISTHIAILASRMSREKSPAPSVSSISSIKARQAARKNSRPLESVLDESLVDRPLISASELSEKRRARKQLESKHVALEEAVERGVCEKVYSKIWRHRSTDDEERDEKLRSRAAALSLVGVDLSELLTSTNDGQGQRAHPDSDLIEDPARARLSEARSNLVRMNQEHSPIGKLQALTATHKSIVEVLSEMFPSSSSADEILPTLIYTIITSSPDDLLVVSNINFIQRFRWANKIDGEAAYCLTNLEAAISFLETVDLSAIRADETKGGPSKSTSQPSTPRTETPNPLYRGLPGTANDQDVVKGEDPPPTSRSASRRLSMLLQSRPRPLDAASGVLSQGTDMAYDTIQNALDGSFKFFFGRIREQQTSHGSDGQPDLTIPKTLEDARKLVSTPPPLAEDDVGVDSVSVGETDDANKQHRVPVTVFEGGRKPSPTASIDSTRDFATTTRRVASPQSQADNTTATTASGQPTAFTAVESMRTLGNSLNPLKGFPGMGMMRGFGRAPSPSSASARPAGEKLLIDVNGIAPPIQKFVALREVKELNGFDIELLLRDYQRLAGALKALQSS
ncbi:hypothetical protein FH972_021916 [Carpinus fangiana]|uniref:VPS9 domain-containing protein n=1 Tax=Carpinus fangiana TaxID=176857 RepID=A0A5N6KR28_9ROSI|nr:hypothetical protein FH972_021916 [Carpinus fangiana]